MPGASTGVTGRTWCWPPRWSRRCSTRGCRWRGSWRPGWSSCGAAPAICGRPRTRLRGWSGVAGETRTVGPRRRRWPISAALSLLLLLVLGIAAWAAAGSGLGPPPRTTAYQPPVRAYHGRYTTAAAIPVIVYHEMDNGCKASAVTCRSKDPESVSTAQFTGEMAWLVRAGYHSVTLSQYTAWLGNAKTTLPDKPVLITADNGIGNFLTGAQPVLARDGFTATAFLVTGFADGAEGACAPEDKVALVRHDV